MMSFTLRKGSQNLNLVDRVCPSFSSTPMDTRCFNFTLTVCSVTPLTHSAAS